MTALRVWRWILENVAVSISVVGLLVFAASYVSYSIYFDRFHVTPSAVGITYADLVVRQTCPTLVLIVLVTGLAWALAIAPLTDRETEYNSLRKSKDPDKVARCTKLLGEIRFTGGVLLALPVILLSIYLALLLRSALVGSTESRAPSLFDPLRITVPSGRLLDHPQTTVLILGETDHHLVVYNPEDVETQFLDPDTKFVVPV